MNSVVEQSSTTQSFVRASASRCGTGFPLPLPGDMAMLIAGYRAAQGEMNPFWALALLEAATLIGGSILYWLGVRGGRPLLYRYGRFIHLDRARLDRAEDWIRQRGAQAIVLGRIVPGLRNVTVIAAGVFGVPYRTFLPAFALGWYFAASHMRLTRSSMLEVLGAEYVKLARLKGLPEARVIAKHALKNALIPVLTLAGINLVIMINVAVVVETVFAWPGIGRLLYEGITFRDFPIVQATVLLGGSMIVFVNLLVDILYGMIDPRIRYER